jgi:putative NADH-flavin reductase
MKIAIIGITGNVGSRLATEALARGHTVTGIARNPAKPAPPGVTLKQGDANQPEQLAPLLRGHDAVISAANFRILPAAPLLRAVKAAGVSRLLIVGGAASLEIAPGVLLFDSPHFPPEYKPEAAAGMKFLEDLRAEPELDWTFLSPPAMFAPGVRTGKFRLGKDQLLSDGNGQSTISMEDFAIALIDELEHPQHLRQRFTVAY